MKKRHLLVVVALSVFIGTALFSMPGNAADITLKFSHHVPAQSFQGTHHQWWADEVAKRTGGRVEVKMFWMQSLAKQTDTLPAVTSGIADLGYITATYFPSNFPLYMSVDVPGNFHSDYTASVLALMDTVDNQPDLKAEMEKNNIIFLGPYISGLTQLGFKKPVGPLQNLKGMTIRSYGGGFTKWLENLGTNPVFMSYNDIYEAIDRGTIKGAFIAFPVSEAFKHKEIMKSIYMTNQGGSLASGFYMNLTVFRKLPKDIQKILMDLRQDMGLRYAQSTQDNEKNIIHDWLMNYNVSFKTLTPDEQKFNNQALSKARASFLEKQVSEGHKAAPKVWAYYSEALRKHEEARAKK